MLLTSVCAGFIRPGTVVDGKLSFWMFWVDGRDASLSGVSLLVNWTRAALAYLALDTHLWAAWALLFAAFW